MADPLLTNICTQLENYARSHASMPTATTQSIEDSFDEVKHITLKSFVDNHLDVPLLPKLMGSEWSTFRSKITAPLDGARERAGIHPRLNQILDAVRETNARFTWQYEKDQADDDGGITIPDFSVHVDGSRTSHLEATVLGRIIHALQLSEGFCAQDLLDCIELAGVFPVDLIMHKLCLGSDGNQLGLSKLYVSRTEWLKVVRTERDCCVLWPVSGEPSTEPDGVTILRSLAAAGPGAWLMAGEPQSFHLAGGVAHANSVLGYGAFCSVLECLYLDEQVCIKRAVYTAGLEHLWDDLVQQLTNEHDVLSAFATANAPHVLPRLHPHSPDISPTTAFVIMKPVGVSLRRMADLLPIDRRRVQAARLVNDANSALAAAHSLGYCHSDIRPGNVVYVESSNTFVLIDWGLERASGEDLHQYRRSNRFFASAVLEALTVNAKGVIPYHGDYDYESVKYVACGFAHGGARLIPEIWEHLSVQTLIKRRPIDLRNSGVWGLSEGV